MRTSLSMLFLSFMLLGTGKSYAQFSLNCMDSVTVLNAFSSEGNGLEAYDGNPGTRWGTSANDPQWVAFELDTVYNINEMIIRWEAANAKNYRVEGSNDTAQGWINNGNTDRIHLIFEYLNVDEQNEVIQNQINRCKTPGE